MVSDLSYIMYMVVGISNLSLATLSMLSLAGLLFLPPLGPIRMTFRHPLGRHQVELMPIFLSSCFLVLGILLATSLMVCH